MRFLLYGIALTAAVFLWLLIKLDRTYTLTHTVLVQVSPEVEPVPISLEVEGGGYDMLRWRRIDTISAARLCIAPPKNWRGIALRWDFQELRRQGICDRLRRIQYKPSLRWVLPGGADFVTPPVWLTDSLWASWDTLPSTEYELVAVPGRHRYPLPLPPQWGVYPETLWVEGHVAQYMYAVTEVTPIAEGTEGYTLVLTPSRVQVRFWVPQAMVDRWKPSDFVVAIDMRKVLPNDSVVYPELRRRPPYVRQVEIIPPALRYTRLY